MTKTNVDFTGNYRGGSIITLKSCKGNYATNFRTLPQIIGGFSTSKVAKKIPL